MQPGQGNISLSTVPLFQSLSVPSLKLLESRISMLRFTKRQGIFTEGDNAHGFYIVTKGRVRVYKLSPEGREQILHIVSEGELLGAVSAFSGDRYPAHAEAMEETECIYISREDLLDLIKREPSIVMNMMANLASRLQHFTTMIENLSLKEVPSRLAAYILYHTGEQDKVFTLDISWSQLASLIGTVPETLSRILKRMNKQGIIKVKGREVHILNRDALESVMEGTIKI